MSASDGISGAAVRGRPMEIVRRPKAFRFRLGRAKTTGQQSMLAGAGGHANNSRMLPPCYPGENELIRLARTQGLSECLSIIEDCRQEAVSEASAACVRQVSDFIAGRRSGERGGRAGAMDHSNIVPLAIVDAGLHLGDRMSAVEQMKKGLSGGGDKSCSPVVTVLRSQDCRTVDAALSQITQQCLALGGTASRRPLFMDNLEEWYNSFFAPSGVGYRTENMSWRAASRPVTHTSPLTTTETGVGPSETLTSAGATIDMTGMTAETERVPERTGGGPGRGDGRVAVGKRRRPPVVVLLEDVEGLDKQVLRDLANVLAQPPSDRTVGSSSTTGKRRRRQEGGGRARARCGRGFPLALVAIASAGVGFPLDRLSASATRQLALGGFPLPSAQEIADVLYEKLLVQGRLPFGVGGRILAWMHASFHDSHQSLTTLARQLQRAALEHFSHAGSYLCLQHCRPWLERHPLYHDCPEEAMAFMCQKLKRDSVRMPAKKLETLLGVSLPTAQSTVTVLSQAQQANADVPAEADQANKLKPQISAEQASSLIDKALHEQATRALRLWFLHKVLMVLDEACERRVRGDATSNRRAAREMRFDTRPTRVVGLFAKSKLKSYYSELTKAAVAMTFLSQKDVHSLLHELLEALPSTGGGLPRVTKQRSASPTAANPRSAVHSSAEDGTLSTAHEAAAGEKSANQICATISPSTNEGADSHIAAKVTGPRVEGENIAETEGTSVPEVAAAVATKERHAEGEEDVDERRNDDEIFCIPGEQQGMTGKEPEETPLRVPGKPTSSAHAITIGSNKRSGGDSCHGSDVGSVFEAAEDTSQSSCAADQAELFSASLSSISAQSTEPCSERCPELGTQTAVSTAARTLYDSSGASAVGQLTAESSTSAHAPEKMGDSPDGSDLTEGLLRVTPSLEVRRVGHEVAVKTQGAEGTSDAVALMPPYVQEAEALKQSRGQTRRIPTAKTPRAIEGLHAKEVLYVRSGARRVMKLWAKAHEEGWAKAEDKGENEALRPLSSTGSSSASVGGSGSGSGSGVAGARAGNGRVTESRGNRLFNSAVNIDSTSGAAGDGGVGDAGDLGERDEGGTLTEPHEDATKREAAMKRACLVRELQLLFLHIMGEARDCPLGPGMEVPPPLQKNASILAEAYRLDDPSSLQSSLCPMVRAKVDEGMMEGAGFGTSEIAKRRKEMSADQPLADVCLLYSRHRSHGKIIDRSDWFNDFCKSVKESKVNSGVQDNKRRAPERRNGDKPSEHSQAGARDGLEVSAVAVDSSSGTAGNVDPSRPSEMRARFGHASNELAFLGYVKAYKRRRREEGRGAGPKGAVTRLVYAYTMEGGAL